MNSKKIRLLFLIVFLSFNLSGCFSSNENEDDRKINLYIGVKDKESLNTIKILTDFYEKNNPKVKININNSILGSKIENNIGDKNDILFVSRNDMLDLASKGILDDMKDFYKENDIATRYYSILKVCGRFNDRYYGIPLMPYSLEFLYNKKYFDERNIKVPDNLDEFEVFLKNFNSSSKSVPMVLNENMDINNAIFSIVANNNIIDIDRMQDVFNHINSLFKSGYIDKNTFELGNEVSIDKFNSGDIPIILLPSYYAGNLDDENIGSISEKVSNMKVPIISDVVVCVPTNAENSEEIDKFMKFAFGDKMQEEFLKRGYITNNKKVNDKNKGIKRIIASHIEDSVECNTAIIDSISSSVREDISAKIDDIFSGEYTGKEWNSIVEKEQQ
ncbi:carbohydrate ABC transporter substrate-binding protein [Clostridium sp. cel8]|jgi:raffinose/stachyose/melibiose transport system substrate-binding protein|uniref:ABC transporter substrate-binding protein n=1 Tax=Clostridium sp. cel8 TaxID=2663123 RepID=UPI0015F4BF5D|nr:ABC transporter substrate-binding protein [Clostridium sp. cel8]MBA5851248.1 carbohydrate ABC transporter substrate-binding protein [Clostridium sp. cel8]